MHCPRCGQQQVSADLKFCSRCGFPLGLVAEILAHGGTLPQLAELEKSCQPWMRRKTGFKFALLWFLLMNFILVPLAAVADLHNDVIAILAVLGFGVPLLATVLSLLFLSRDPKSVTSEREERQYPAQEPYLSGNSGRTAALPPPTSSPVSAYAPPANAWKAPDTGELVPRSVTEGTTKLLQKDE
jgi:hypothetical protein